MGKLKDEVDEKTYRRIMHRRELERIEAMSKQERREYLGLVKNMPEKAAKEERERTGVDE